MLLILIITTYKEKPRTSDACWLLIFCENQIGELTPQVCAAIGWFCCQSKIGGVIIDFDDFLIKPKEEKNAIQTNS